MSFTKNAAQLMLTLLILGNVQEARGNNITDTVAKLLGVTAFAGLAYCGYLLYKHEDESNLSNSDLQMSVPTGEQKNEQPNVPNNDPRSMISQEQYEKAKALHAENEKQIADHLKKYGELVLPDSFSSEKREDWLSQQMRLIKEQTTYDPPSLESVSVHVQQRYRGQLENAKNLIADVKKDQDLSGKITENQAHLKKCNTYLHSLFKYQSTQPYFDCVDGNKIYNDEIVRLQKQKNEVETSIFTHKQLLDKNLLKFGFTDEQKKTLQNSIKRCSAQSDEYCQQILRVVQQHQEQSIEKAIQSLGEINKIFPEQKKLEEKIKRYEAQRPIIKVQQSGM